jgi:hypothetical protein
MDIKEGRGGKRNLDNFTYGQYLLKNGLLANSV